MVVDGGPGSPYHAREVNPLAHQPMSQAQRRDLRGQLINLGFERTNYTKDLGDGRYSEFWTRLEDPAAAAVVQIHWGHRGALSEDTGV